MLAQNINDDTSHDRQGTNETKPAAKVDSGKDHGNRIDYDDARNTLESPSKDEDNEPPAAAASTGKARDASKNKKPAKANTPKTPTATKQMGPDSGTPQNKSNKSTGTKDNTKKEQKKEERVEEKEEHLRMCTTPWYM